MCDLFFILFSSFFLFFFLVFFFSFVFFCIVVVIACALVPNKSYNADVQVRVLGHSKTPNFKHRILKRYVYLHQPHLIVRNIATCVLLLLINDFIITTTTTNVITAKHIQNALARTVVQAPKFKHITPILKFLHWLKVSERIEYKIIYLTKLTIPLSNCISMALYLFSHLMVITHALHL